MEIEGVLHLMGDETSDECFFPDRAFERLYKSEEKNFWFRVRNKIIGNAISGSLDSHARILEVGCGTGFVSKYLKKKGYHVECAELFPDALQFCKKRGAGDRYYQFNVLNQVFLEEFDGICAFDVIEHINDDSTVIKNLYTALKPNGTLFITVPADMRLWSERDIRAEHKRRYSIRELQQKLEKNGFSVVKMSYFMTFLYPVIFFSRKVSLDLGRGGKENSTEMVEQNAMSELQPNSILNFIFLLIFSMEVPFIRIFDFPFGSSLMCVAVKNT
jgi:2-polyprenyl-3-methyl-5-hydroxy-6-metoxy-1,4-benzoquinol methylase